MSNGPSASAPRHMAGVPRPAVRAEVDAPAEEVPVPAQVKRSRMAFAMAVTVAALPILVVDNLPATADPEQVDVAAAGGVAGGELAADAAAAVVTLEDAVVPEAATPPADLPVADPVADLPVTEAPAPSTTAPPSTEAPDPTSPPASAAPLRTVSAPKKSAPETTAPAPTTTSTTAPPVARVSSVPTGSGAADPADPAVWERLAQCESSGNWAANTGNGYYGGLQFSLATWHDFGGTGYPHHAPKATQIATAKKLQAKQGWSAWPGCARKLDLHG